ncbi:hypothetical protein ACT3N8_13305 [Psychrobacter aquimaris]|uniref:hypothetical protein n=1 Tax=Psychrobacter TaxID=497 RepID=UPI000ED866B9|nr:MULTISPECIES: hypothetical protein [Psychrobacter]HCT72478.1 hypothetical protein [Psychrobacter sp.]
MQMKHLIIFALVGMVALLGFNLINGSQREKDRESITTSSSTEQASTGVTESDSNNDEKNSSVDITSKPLGEQPKAILDSATTQIEQAQQADQQRLDQSGVQ